MCYSVCLLINSKHCFLRSSNYLFIYFDLLIIVIYLIDFCVKLPSFACNLEVALSLNL